MTQVLETALNTVLTVLSTVWFWLGQPGLNPISWNGLTWMFAGLLLLGCALFIRSSGRGETRAPNKPQLLISKGSIEQLENSSLQYLNFTISNLSNAPVQLLELVLQTNLSRPLTIEAVELLLPYEMVELEATLPTELIGDGGSLQAFAFVSQRRSNIYNLRAKLVWEPWQKRFKILPTGQSVQVARKLNSARLDALRQQAWREHNPHLTVTPPGSLTPVGEQKRTQTSVKVKKALDLDFPTKF